MNNTSSKSNKILFYHDAVVAEEETATKDQLKMLSFPLWYSQQQLQFWLLLQTSKVVSQHKMRTIKVVATLSTSQEDAGAVIITHV